MVYIIVKKQKARGHIAQLSNIGQNFFFFKAALQYQIQIFKTVLFQWLLFQQLGL